MESISPNFFVRDINQTIAFYKELGFSVVMTVPETGNFDWVMMNKGKVNFMFQSFSSIGDDLPQISRNDGGSLLLYIQVTGILAFFETLKGKATIVSDLQKTFYGATEFSILDCNGFVLTFAEDVEAEN